MQNRRLFITWTILLLSQIFFIKSKAQQCTSGNPPDTITLECGYSCADLIFTIPDIRETSDYITLDRPWLPYPFESRTSPAVTFASPPAWPGNSYSGIQNLPFTFCFFDSLYDHFVIGANGCVSFDTNMALKFCEPRLFANTTVRPLPSTAYARALIAGVMQDLDPFDTARAVTGEKVEFRIEGTAPCRRAVISYYRIPLWPGTGNCQSSINTYQIVLHEGTGIIDVYQKDKPPCGGSNNRIAILGIQNWARNYTVAPRFRNGYDWGGNNINEAHRFLPFGGNSRFIQAQLWDGPRLLNTSTATTPAAQGEMTVQFNSVCPPPSTNFLVLKTTYGSCTGSGVVELFDTVYIIRNTNLYATAEIVPASCGGSNGSITVHVPGGTGVLPYSYSLNGAPFQRDSLFSGLTAGFYTVQVRDAGNCSSTITVQVRGVPILSPTFVVDTPSCNLANDGSITATVLNGNPPYQFSLNSGPFQTGYVFSNLSPGFYTVEIQDATGCRSSSLIDVPAGAPLAATIQTTNTSCSGVNNGTITVTPQNGSAPYQYALNGGPFQSSNVFTNLAVGNYTIQVIDGSGCNVNNLPAIVQAGQPLTASAIKTDVACNGGSTGNITVTVNNGTGPYQYSLDGVNYQTSNSFNGLAAGNYTVYINDNNSCSGTVNITLAQPSTLTTNTSTQAVRCNGESNGVITVNGSGGTAPYQYSIDGINYQGGNSFNGLPAASYTLYVRDNNSCIITATVNLTQPSILQFSTTTQNASCGGGNDGKIIVSPSGGNGNYQYSSDGINFQSSNTLNVAPGTYTVHVRDVNGCSASPQSNIIVGLSNTLAIRTINDTSICLPRSINLNAISTANQYSWTPATGLSNSTTANPIATPTVTTTYIVNASLGPCRGSDTVTITVLPAPTANAGNDAIICLDDSIQLSGTGGISYRWTPATGLNNAAFADPFAKPLQTITYNLIVTDVNGCTSLTPDAVTVSVIQPPRINITPDTYASPGDVVQLHAEGGVNYLWTPPTGLDNPAIADPRATITQDITYTVLVTTAEGCRAQDSVSIKGFKGPEIYVPSAFTPNHDGKNDKFVPIPVGIKEIKFFRIYNRWGQLVFTTNKQLEGWDGRLGGRELESGVFVWIIQAVTSDDRVIFKRGTVTLIR